MAEVVFARMHDCDRERFAVKVAAHVFVLSLSVVTAFGLTICPQYVGLLGSTTAVASSMGRPGQRDVGLSQRRDACERWRFY